MSTALAPGGWCIFFIPAESFGKSRHFALLRQLFGVLRMYVEVTHAFDLFVFWLLELLSGNMFHVEHAYSFRCSELEAIKFIVLCVP
jgi:hypothetical protein